jgi:hypothetical protein
MTVSYLVSVSFVEQLVGQLQCIRVVDSGSITTRKDAAVTALDSQVVICEHTPACCTSSSSKLACKSCSRTSDSVRCLAHLLQAGSDPEAASAAAQAAS